MGRRIGKVLMIVFLLLAMIGLFDTFTENITYILTVLLGMGAVVLTVSLFRKRAEKKEGQLAGEREGKRTRKHNFKVIQGGKK